ncbi:DUF4191 domain-containing protein [Nocardioides coralli]|uniref:DUF4191 domain-containing protein n=1 Tax=Nocardioides coralli TaxID=2872154 RepID=UPI001CA402B5|nr:DUF4191 domain-containing protein [Nocardioides coralli]QZY30375.1 DUF4191 domain-containing protein [Nocardioides coralli]
MSDLDPSKMNRRQQLRATYRMAKQTDRRLGLWLLGAFVLGAALGFALFWLLPGSGTVSLVLSIIGALMLGLLALLIVFGRRAQAAAYKQMEGQLGGGARALSMLRRGWRTDQMVAFNKQQDMVHRVVGPPGIVLVGEGNASRLKALLATEERRHARVASEVPIHTVVVGDGEGQVPVRKLVRHVNKLGRKVKGAELTDVLSRLKAIDANRPNIPLPKGPIPTSMKGLRGQMRGR